MVERIIDWFCFYFAFFAVCFPYCSQLVCINFTFKITNGVSQIKREKGAKAEKQSRLGPGRQPRQAGSEGEGLFRSLE